MHQECSSFNAQKEKKFTLIREYDPESNLHFLDQAKSIPTVGWGTTMQQDSTEDQKIIKYLATSNIWIIYVNSKEKVEK